jgi:hypothetical protein
VLLIFIAFRLGPSFSGHASKRFLLIQNIKAENLLHLDKDYIFNIAKKEIFMLIGYGFSYQDLKHMPIAERRHYFSLYADLQKKIKDNSS